MAAAEFWVNIYTITVLVKSINLCFSPTRLGFFIGLSDPSKESAGSDVLDRRGARRRVKGPFSGRASEKFFFNIY
jgi:hypothetical protein